MIGSSRTLVNLALCLVVGMATQARAGFDDFNNWTLVEDPADPNMSANVDSAAAVTLNAIGPVPNAVDIGYQSVDDDTVAASTAGYAFDPMQSFAIAVDYDLSFLGSPDGGIGIGFGIGEDADGTNSAGVALAFNDGAGLATAGVARVNDVDAASPIAIGAAADGSMHVSYDATTGDIVVGVGTVGDSTPSTSTTLDAADVSDLWQGDWLLASLFLRSDAVAGFGVPFTAGEAEAVFSDVRVTSGSAVFVPEPASIGFLLAGGAMLIGRRQSRRPS